MMTSSDTELIHDPGRRYQIIKELGTGGMGSVFLARDVRLGRDIALKKIHPHLISDLTAKERFRNESRATASLSHENIVSLYDVEDGDEPCLVMEYVCGCTLSGLLQNNAPFPSLVLLEISRQLMEGLAAAHEKKIVHRDIKPANLLIDERGCLKITDFGVAHVIQQAFLTATGQFLGTPQYIAPEIIRDNIISDRSDLFSAGCVLYQCATGKVPFSGDTPHRILQQICEAEPEKAGLKNSKLHPFLEALLLRLLSKSPDSRTSAQDIVTSIEEFSMENRLRLGKWRLKGFVRAPEEYTLAENRELCAHFLEAAESEKKQGKSVRAHKSLYMARRFGSLEEVKKLTAGRLRRRAFIIGSVIVMLTLLSSILIFFLPGNTSDPRNSAEVSILPSVPDASVQSPVKAVPVSGGGNGTSSDSGESPANSISAPGPVRVKAINRPVSAHPVPKTVYGFVTVKTRPPFADISIDGVPAGKSPMNRPVKLSCGRHELTIEKNGYRPLLHQLKIDREDTVRLAFELQQNLPP